MRLFLLLAAAALAAAALGAQTPKPPADPGVKIGQKIPAFELKDQAGKVRNFNTIRGPKGALLVFFRSADW